MTTENYNRYKNPNYVEKLRRLYEWFVGEKPLPFKIAMIPTNRCNFNCFFCPNSVARGSGRFKAEDELNKGEWLDIVDQGLEMNVHEWRFLGGGEPLVRYDTTLSMVYKIKNSSVNKNCEIITNGFMFESKDIKNLVELKMDRIIFSIHGSEKETQEYLSGVPGSFDRVTKNLLLFKEFKEKFDTDKPVIQINSVITNRNYNKIVEIVDYSKKVGCNELALHPMRAYEEIKSQVQHLVMSHDEEKVMLKGLQKAKLSALGSNLILDLAMMEEAYDMSNENCASSNEDREHNHNNSSNPNARNTEKLDDGNKNATDLKHKFLNARCFEPFYGLLICPEGKASHCVPHGMGIDELDVRKMSLKEIWFSDYFDKVRKNILDNIMMECCLKCGLLDMSKELREDLELFVKEFYED